MVRQGHILAQRGGRKSGILTGLIVVIIVLALLGWAAFSISRSWTAPREQYALQGINISAEDGEISWPSMAAQNINFAYMLATRSSDYRDPSFAAHFNGAQDVEIGFGALHHYSLCRLATDQSENFVTTVPRRPGVMPPAVYLAFEEGCDDRPARELVLSELTTFLNQIEAHSGKRAIVRMSEEFEETYRIGADIGRNIWLEGNFFPPDYSAKPWIMWSDNDSYIIDGIEEPVEHVVIRQEQEQVQDQVPNGAE